MEEIWKDIIGYEGLYQVSNLGNVKSLDRIDSIGHIRKGKILDSSLVRDYYRVCLSKNGERIVHMIHRLVAEAFIPNPDNLNCVNHKDEDKTNNCVDNLEWCTNEYNLKYGTARERAAKSRTKPVIQYDLYGNVIKEWSSVSEVVRQTGYGQGNISNCCNNNLNTAYGYVWRFDNI